MFSSCKWAFLSVILLVLGVSAQYQPTWNSLDTRPLPSWYDKAKFGIFIHWGVFSVPAFGGNGAAAEWYWNYYNDPNQPEFKEFQQRVYGDQFQYQDFASMFHAELFQPTDWAKIFANSGAKYVVLTSKHHEGWTNWPSSVAWNWNSVDNGPHRDLVGDLSKAVRAANLTFGLYHSLFEWYNPLYLQDKAGNFNTTTYVDEIAWPELKEIVTAYQPDVIWSDGDWEAPDTYWKSQEFIAWLYNDSPVKDTVVTNDRWGDGCSCKHGGFYTCSDRYSPGKLQNHKWENCLTIDATSWGWSRTSPLSSYLSVDELLYQLVSTVSCGGNMLLNVGPSSDGLIPIIFQDRLASLGAWLSVNGEAIYETTPWRQQNETANNTLWYTQNVDKDSVYAIALYWPGDGDAATLNLKFPIVTTTSQVTLLGYGNLQFKAISAEGGISIALPDQQTLPAVLSHAYVFKLVSVR